MEKENLKPLDWYEITDRLKGYATSDLARAQIAELKPLPSIEAAQKSMQMIADAQVVLHAGERPFMESIDHFSGWYDRLKKEAVLTPVQLKDVRRFCIECVALSEVLRPFSDSWSLHVKKRLMDATRPLSAVDQVLGPNGEIRTDASETLHQLHREKSSQTRALQLVLDRLVKDFDMEPVLQEKFVTTREGRWVIPVKSGMQGFFPGIIHSASQSKQTVFMEPDEVVPLNNRLRQLEVAIEEEIERILQQLSDYLRSHLLEFKASSELLLEVDIKLAEAKLSEVLEAHAPVFDQERLHLLDLRHPILALKNEVVVANTVQLDGNRRVLLLSGPNAGGKTVLLKSIALAAQMARCGLPICAEQGSTLPFFAHFAVAVGDAQNIDMHLSTFAAHLSILDAASQAHGSETLILIDEICGSTDPEEGSALARSFIETYAKNGVFAIVTSHLGPLKTGWTTDSGVINGSLEYDSKSGRPTYQFLMGVPGSSLALQTAQRVGVRQNIIARAIEHLSPEARAQHQSISEVEKLKEDLHALRQDLNQELKLAREHKKKYFDMLSLFKRDRDVWMERTVKKAERRIDDLIEKTNVDSIFKKHEKLSSIKTELPEVIKSSQLMPKRPKIDSVEEFEKIYPPGSLVFVPSLNQEGIIQGKANSKGEIPIVSNSMRLFLHWQQLKPTQSVVNPTQNILRRTTSVTVTLQENERVIDVRGLSVDEAISKLESQLDAATLNQESRVRIVHGHGMEILKKAIRAHLSRSLYVRKWKAGTNETGGDGVTWADLRD